MSLLFSQKDQGSQFVVKIPYQESEQPVFTSSRPGETGKAAEHPTLSGHVLLAEDTPALQTMQRRMLEQKGITVTLANNGQEAVEQSQRTPFDLILMDMQMPVMDGLEATRIIKSRADAPPVVALSANVMSRHQNQFAQAGGDGFIEKPIDPHRLNAVLEQYLPKATAPTLPLLIQSPPAARTEVCFEDESINSELNALFNDFIDSSHEKLSKAIATDDWTAIRKVAHQVKGSGSMFGHPELTTMGETICLAAAQGERPIELAKTLQQSLKEIPRK
jgi:two-component system sensor histidine kinase/response regulator